MLIVWRNVNSVSVDDGKNTRNLRRNLESPLLGLGGYGRGLSLRMISEFSQKVTTMPPEGQKVAGKSTKFHVGIVSSQRLL